MTLRSRRLVTISSLLLILTAGMVGMSLVATARLQKPAAKPVPVNILPVPATEVDKANAWTEACRLSSATAKEQQSWTRPDTIIIPRARWMILGNRLPNRLCGQMSVYYEEPDVTGDNIAQYIEVYVRPQERTLLANVLTHEYLHAIWFNRAFYDMVFLQANPDSEAFVVNLLPNICPAI
jgi:hypothetical protein